LESGFSYSVDICRNCQIAINLLSWVWGLKHALLSAIYVSSVDLFGAKVKQNQSFDPLN